jgi:hypothetical protein
MKLHKIIKIIINLNKFDKFFKELEILIKLIKRLLLF